MLTKVKNDYSFPAQYGVCLPIAKSTKELLIVEQDNENSEDEESLTESVDSLSSQNKSDEKIFFEMLVKAALQNQPKSIVENFKLT